MLKKLFGKGAPEKKRELTIEDLITLERYEDAADRLEARIKTSRKDLHSHLKLAEVYLGLKDVKKALGEYVFVADSQAEDGFFDKGIALLSKAVRLAPGDDTLPRRIAIYRRKKRLEHRRRLAIEGLRSNSSAGALAAGDSVLAVEMLWNKIAKSHLVEQLAGEQLKRLFAAMELLQLPRGEILAEQGDSHSMMFLVVDGMVDAEVEMAGKFTNVRSFSTGDLIGESALIERKTWPARYQATTPVTVFRLGRRGLQQSMVGAEDPRGFLGVLRKQQNDRDVAVSIQRLGV